MEKPFTLYHLLLSSEEALIESMLELLEQEDEFPDGELPGDEMISYLLNYSSALDVIPSRQTGDINIFSN